MRVATKIVPAIGVCYTPLQIFFLKEREGGGPNGKAPNPHTDLRGISEGFRGICPLLVPISDQKHGYSPPFHPFPRLPTNLFCREGGYPQLVKKAMVGEPVDKGEKGVGARDNFF